MRKFLRGFKCDRKKRKILLEERCGTAKVRVCLNGSRGARCLWPGARALWGRSWSRSSSGLVQASRTSSSSWGPRGARMSPLGSRISSTPPSVLLTIFYVNIIILQFIIPWQTSYLISPSINTMSSSPALFYV